MEKWILVTRSNCSDPAREKEFNEWYDNIHIPDISEIPGFGRTTRYVDPDAGKGEPKFIGIYEIETEDIKKTIELQDKHVAKKKEMGRWNDLVVRAAPRSYYKQIYP